MIIHEHVHAKWLTLFGITVFVLMGCIATFNAWIDPFHLIHSGRIYVTDRNFQRYMNAGLIRNEPPFEAAFVGSSYIANFDVDQVERLFGQKARVISVYGATFKEIIPTLEYVLKKRKLKTVFLDVSAYGWCGYADHPFWEFPKGLYQDNPFSTVAYLIRGPTTRLSFDVIAFEMFGKARLPLSYNWKDVARFYETQKDRFDAKFIAPMIQKDLNFSIPAIVRSKAEITKLANANVDCFRKVILPVLKSYPETQFYLFNPPVLQQLLRYRALLGHVEIWNHAQEAVSNELQQLENARYFDFYAAGEIENDCRKFMDMGHFDQQSSDLLLHWMKEGRFERTSKTNAKISADVVKVASAQLECPPKED